MIRYVDNCISLGITHCKLSENTSCLVSSKSLNDVNVHDTKRSLLRDKDSINSGTN